MAKRKNIILAGQRFGKLTATGVESKTGSGNRRMEVLCSCGETKHVAPFDLVNGKVVSCGCWNLARVKAMGKNNKTHGHTRDGKRSPTYLTWCSMISRCYDPKMNGYVRYGGKGITVCERWRTDFGAFLDDMGERPEGETLDRIDGSKGYAPENCRWATYSEQMANRRNTRWITYKGETKTAIEWAKLFNTHRNNIYRRDKRGAPLEG